MLKKSRNTLAFVVDNKKFCEEVNYYIDNAKDILSTDQGVSEELNTFFKTLLSHWRYKKVR